MKNIIKILIIITCLALALSAQTNQTTSNQTTNQTKSDITTTPKAQIPKTETHKGKAKPQTKSKIQDHLAQKTG